MPSRLVAVIGVALALAVTVALGVWLVIPTARTPAPGGGPERCLSCHAPGGADDPGGAHAAAQIGCRACHLGDPSATTAEAAHVGLEREPGALDTVASTCGTCHAREVARVETSLMATARGLIAVDRWAMGELPHPDGDETMATLLANPHPSPAEDHLRKLCAGCHLGTRRANRDDAVVAIGSGCGACHGGPRAAVGAERHRPLDGLVDDQRCFGCHSRSGRISLSYRGLAEIDPAPATPPAACGARHELPDGRTVCEVPADVHQRAGMACIDCHLDTDLMGDGVAYAHAADAVEVTCQSCHGPVAPGGETTWGAVKRAVVAPGQAERGHPIALDRLRQLGEERPDDERVRLGRRGTPLWNLRPTTDDAGVTWRLRSKLAA